MSRPVELGDQPIPSYRRILLKLSGDAFAPPGHEFGISERAAHQLAAQLQEIVAMGVQVATVVAIGVTEEASARCWELRRERARTTSSGPRSFGAWSSEG